MGAGRRSSKDSVGVMQAKYLDYCSAQVADLLLYLSPDEIYLLAQRAHREKGGGGDLSYVEMVQLATDWLALKIQLPPFDLWLADYRAHPEAYEEYLLGLWEGDAGDPADT